MHQFFLELLVFTEHHFRTWGYFIAFLAAFVEGIPILGTVIPGASIEIAVGAYAKFSHLKVLPLIAFGTLGAFLGDLIGYCVGYVWGNHAVKILGKWMFYTEERKHKMEKLLHRHPGKLIILGRFNTLTRALAPMLFGAVNFNLATYCMYAFASSLLWSVVHIEGGFLFGKAIQIALRYTSMFIVVAIVMSAVIYGLYRLIDRHHHVFKKYYVYVLAFNIFSIFSFTEIYRQVYTHGWITNIDIFISGVVQKLPYSHTTDFFAVLTALVDPVNAVLLALVLLVYALHKKHYADAILVLVTFTISTVLDLALKTITNVPRPIDAFVHIATQSFPSGHVVFATTLALLLVIMFVPRLYNKNNMVGAVFISLCSFAFVISIGISRVYVRAHWVSDVVGGLMLGIFSVTLSLILIRSIRLIHSRYSRVIIKSENTD